jgi:hypothetical protein
VKESTSESDGVKGVRCALGGVPRSGGRRPREILRLLALKLQRETQKRESLT